MLEFIRALDDYKLEKNRPFPTWSEVLEVIKRLGYRRGGRLAGLLGPLETSVVACTLPAPMTG